MLFLLAVLVAPVATEAATIWTGPTMSFVNHLVSDVDQITPNVWLTRASTRGIYNAALESSFTHNFSPADTEWANGTTANYASLSYTDWNTWADGVNPGPPGTVGVNAVVHLISEDIYLDITFTSWPDGHSGNTGFSYNRSTPAVVNNPPSVTITNPASGAVFAAPANITIQASASDPDTGDSVTNVQFLVGSTVLTNEATDPFTAVTNNLPAGDYTLTAIASDDNGATATNSVNIIVDTPPAVTITNPLNNAVLSAPANVTIQASASDPDPGGSVTNVQFLVGSTVLTNQTTTPFSAATNNLAAGSYILKAIASDNLGVKTTNSVNISVVTPVPIVISSPSRPSSTNFQFSYTANAGLGYIVQRSTNLLSNGWITLVTNTAAASQVSFSDTNAAASPGFYRVGRLPNP